MADDIEEAESSSSSKIAGDRTTTRKIVPDRKYSYFILFIILTAVVVPCLMPRFTVATYNPLSLGGAGRSREVSLAFKHTAIVGLPGTQIRAPAGELAMSRSEDCHHHVQFGWQRGPMTNKSAGCSIYLNKRYFKAENIRKVMTPPPVLAGRGGAIRLSSGWFDYTVIVAYFPPRPQLKALQAAYQKTVTLLRRWIDKILSEAPARSTPLLFTDLNDTTAIPAAGTHVEGSERAIGTVRGEDEHFAATSMRELTTLHHMSLVNTFMSGNDTYFAYNKSSRIDYIAVPQNLMESVEQSWVDLLVEHCN